MGHGPSVPAELPEAEKRTVLDGDVSLDAVAARIKDGRLRNIVVLTGAGASVSAGLPDFRSPKSGLYDRLAEYGLKDPQQVFQLGYFDRDPRPFFRLARELFCEAGTIFPTPTHHFLGLLASKGLLLRHFDQVGVSKTPREVLLSRARRAPRLRVPLADALAVVVGCGVGKGVGGRIGWWGE
jgi:Sir2 family